MSWQFHDPDEWIWVPGKCESWGVYPGTSVPFGMASGGHYEKRSAEETARIKAEKERLREDAVLAEADAIRMRRAAKKGAA